MGAIGDWIGGMLCEEGDTECTEMWSKWGDWAVYGIIGVIVVIAAYMMLGRGGGGVTVRA